MRNGKLITIEGIAGSDRTQYLHRLAQYLIDAGRTVLDLREPLWPQAGPQRRTIHAEHLSVIDTALKGGCTVLAEGFFDSEIPWHNQLPDVPFPKLARGKKVVRTRIKPDLSFVLESDLADGWNGALNFDAATNPAAIRDWVQSESFLAKTEARWLEMIAQADWPVYLIPAQQSAALIQRQIIYRTNQLLDQSGLHRFSQPLRQPTQRPATPKFIKLPQQATA